MRRCKFDRTESISEYLTNNNLPEHGKTVKVSPLYFLIMAANNNTEKNYIFFNCLQKMRNKKKNADL